MSFNFNISNLISTNNLGLGILDSSYKLVLSDERKTLISYIIDTINRNLKTDIFISSANFWDGDFRYYFLIKENKIVSYLLTDKCMININNRSITSIIINIFSLKREYIKEIIDYYLNVKMISIYDCLFLNFVTYYRSMIIEIYSGLKIFDFEIKSNNIFE